MKKLSTLDLLNLFPEHKGKAKDDISIYEVFTDSRHEASHGLFVPIIGENFDAHDYILEAIDNGAVAALWSKNELHRGIPTDFPIFFVEDTIEALQDVATYYREQKDPIVIGITGSNGKTTTKELVAACMSEKYKVTKTSGNLNNHIGLPRSILSMEPDTEVLVLEMGMSQFGEIETLSKISKPDVAIITNIGESHIEHLGSRAGIAKAKSEILAGLKDDGIFIIDGDESLLKNHPENVRTLTCGFDENNDFVISNFKQGVADTSFHLNDESFSIPLLGRHQAKNFAFAFATSKYLGISGPSVQSAMKQLNLPSMRFEKLETTSGATVINDAYNASATSMIASIDVVKEMPFKKKIIVLGDVLELGSFSQQEHEKVGAFIDNSVDILYTFGNESQHIQNALSENFIGLNEHFTSREELIGAIKENMTEDSIILFKASRGLRFEEIIEEILKT
ncbi:UDP-N-acetylmuramoyl-tripeptide--D-alanyl-D-alanine ligase [Halalkalibacillus sediminis]|uniref:UDP-N-acetylmuramoyl-tripeptide--D-alanyl-D-alanine ligase n=1 Tax=Halalkalibacillus sediminis TaxID=2018042 RepID=A0A2I0QW27_9BACI|nr:UDP-N-acetylmuramoyl-tripeptide--D-alanyl-D-alanine ligase [Halalkalibacillus sediminis]PKR78536.1 UDP-N-acetylmuramoyl-tripeptide--D-alanyl-D-alanine ligase [Halalkalibacillus sediminis]